MSNRRNIEYGPSFSERSSQRATALNNNIAMYKEAILGQRVSVISPDKGSRRKGGVIVTILGGTALLFAGCQPDNGQKAIATATDGQKAEASATAGQLFKDSVKAEVDRVLTPTSTATLTVAQQVEGTVSALAERTPVSTPFATATIGNEKFVVTVTRIPEPTAKPVVQPTAEVVKPTVKGPEKCDDGELVFVHAADQGGVLPRIPVGEAERVDIVEISWPGKGFGGFDRIILVTPRKGPVWEVNVKPGAKTIAERGFCGSNEDVAAWAVKAHVPSLEQASRDANGNQPSDDEIGVYRLNYEDKALVVVKAAGKGPDPKELLDKIDLSFHEGNIASNVPLHVQ